MQLRMWMYDLAREQCPTLDHLRRICQVTIDGGYDALGLYLEHRFAYPSTPWSHGVDCVTPEMILTLRSEFPDLRLIPFVNLLGHFEGMMYTEEGKQYREAMLEGLQACPSNPAFMRLCEGMINDVLAVFDDELVHIGGDETGQLGQCPLCKKRMEDAGEGDGKAEIYGAHFGPLSALVSSKGRRAGVWGDMFLTHPTALDYMPKDTLIFDWQYFSGVSETAAVFTAKGFEVVGCPTIQTYNATWCHVEETEKNVRDVRDDVVADGLFGVCVTTWECGLMGSFDTLFPMLKACGGLLNGSEVSLLDGYEPGEREWVRLMGMELKSAGGSFAAGRIRSSLKVRLLLNANPFLAWMHHASEFEGEVGDRALAVIADAFFAAPGEAEKGICLFARSGIEFVRLAEAARVLYAAGQPEAAIAKLGVTRKLFDDLGVVANRTYERIGGSLADVERCRIAREHVETVIKRIRQYGNGSLGYLPAFEILTHPKFCPHDQASWWLINKWANQ